MLGHTGALYEETNFVLVRHADATVHLYALIGCSLRNLTQFSLGCTGVHSNIFRLRVDSLKRLQYNRPCELQLSKKLCCTVL